MSSHSRHFVDEWLNAKWTTYAISELERDFARDEDQVLQRLDTLTLLLSQGRKQSAKQRAEKLLRNWLNTNADHPHAARLRLRLVILLKGMSNYRGALQQNAILLKADPDSAPLHCLQGLLHGYTKERDAFPQAVIEFDQAMSLSPDWMEPVLELVEKSILLGSDYWSRAIQEAGRALERQDLTPREMVSFQAYKVVAHVLQEPAYTKETVYGDQIFRTESIKIPKEDQEDWFVDKIYDYVKKHFEGRAQKETGELRDSLLNTRDEMHTFLRKVAFQLVPDDSNPRVNFAK